MTDSKPTEAMVEAYRKAKDEAAGWCGCYDSDENRHYIVKGNEIVWEKISEDYDAGHAAMKSVVRRLRDVHALSAALAQPGLPTENCCKCGRIIDTREISEGGDTFGEALEDGRWTCSIECWEAIVDPEALALPLPVQEPVASTHEERIALAKALSWDVTEISPDDVKGILAELAKSGFRLAPLPPFPSIPEEKGGTAESVEIARLRAALKSAEEELSRIDCEGVTETRSIVDAFERAKFFASRSAASIRAVLASPTVKEGSTDV